MTRKEIIKPHLLASIERLKKFIELDAPAVITGAEALNIYTTTLAAYGEAAGSRLIQRVIAAELHGRGLCQGDDCSNSAQRPGTGLCKECEMQFKKYCEEELKEEG